MAFRNIIIENPARISSKGSRIIISTDSEHSLPAEDISALMIENRSTTITAAALSQLGHGGCCVFICDEKHMPCAVLEPFSRHSRALSMLKAQIGASEALKKRLWQSIVMSKIKNQAECLKLNGLESDGEAIANLSGRVRSGDSENLEAVAAQKYFPALMGRGFTRANETARNSALNYGYAIIRGCTARFLALYGFAPALGLHHRSELNNFNLADDIMEPFRPVIDLIVSTLVSDDDEELTPQMKRLLFNSLNLDIISGGQHHSVAYAIERTVRSLSRSLSEGKAQLCLPELIELSQHRYE